MNVLIIGYNAKYAKLFSLFSDNVYVLVQKVFSKSEKDNIPRISEELDYCYLIESDLVYGSSSYNKMRSKEVAQILKDRSIDVVMTNRKDDMVQARKAIRVGKSHAKLLSTFHNSLAWQNPIKVVLLAMLIRACCDGCICLSSFVHKWLTRCHMKSEKLLYLPNTIEYEGFERKQTYELDADQTIRLCYTAVLRPLKNQEFIIEVVNQLKDKYSLRVDLYGDLADEEYVKGLRRKIEEYGLGSSIALNGRVDNKVIEKILSLSDIYFSSTKIEMSPYNILEAKAAGLPILASGVPGQSDLIESGKDGLLYEPDNVEDAANKLELLINDKALRQRLGNSGYEMVSDKKSYKVASKELESFVVSMCKQ